MHVRLDVNYNYLKNLHPGHSLIEWSVPEPSIRFRPRCNHIADLIFIYLTLETFMRLYIAPRLICQVIKYAAWRIISRRFIAAATRFPSHEKSCWETAMRVGVLHQSIYPIYRVIHLYFWVRYCRCERYENKFRIKVIDILKLYTLKLFYDLHGDL